MAEEQFSKMREFSRVDAYLPMQVMRVVPAEERETIRSRTSGQATSMETRDLPDLQDKLLNDWIRLLNAKLDTVVNMLVLQREGFSTIPVTRVNVSGGGLGFLTRERYALGNILEIKVVLPMMPPVALFVYGEVVKLDLLKNVYSIATKFVAMDEDVRDEVVKYVFRRQREILREQRR
ncbi:MAG: PilZ domain-containing protein [Nitrospirae bacterium]|nr:PilZ domain-containing protein [Nitrospirota bacterium]